MTEEGNLQGRIESILFVAGEAVSIKELAKALQTDEESLKTELDRIGDEYDFNQRGFMLKRFGNHVQLATRPLYADAVVRLLQPVQQQSLTQAAMETLAVVAYKQPVTRAEVEQITGFSTASASRLLRRMADEGKIRTAGNGKNTRYYPVALS